MTESSDTSRGVTLTSMVAGFGDFKRKDLAVLFVSGFRTSPTRWARDIVVRRMRCWGVGAGNLTQRGHAQATDFLRAWRRRAFTAPSASNQDAPEIFDERGKHAKTRTDLRCRPEPTGFRLDFRLSGRSRCG